MSVKKLYIDGEWVEGSEGKTFFSTNPATGEVIAEIAQASVQRFYFRFRLPESGKCHCQRCGLPPQREQLL